MERAGFARNLWLGLALLGLVLGAPALAHGPSMRITYDGVRPAQLVIRAGQTVHFHNASTTARSFTVVADDQSFESPTLARGEGWHHTFEEAGEFPFHLAEVPERTGLVVVAPAE